ncbi:MAG TPA: glycosyltransferase family 4 protein, partial [Candidatus Angelobacter sp.]|nr:glycosyltransferase family 4 protein [Candidatus Angelobacter sp.]
MKILITNAHLENYAGSEVVVRDLALELQRRGHEPLVYSPKLGAIAQELIGKGVQVTDQLSELRTAPDIIHGQHHPQTIEALLHFPSVPAIFACLAATYAVEEPFYFPRILRYIAVDERCRQRIENTPAVPPERIEVFLNTVDLERFRSRGPLPDRPRRALVYSNYADRYTHWPAVRKACRQAGLDVDVIGRKAGNATANPQSTLPDYDIVFAKAGCALQALAVGNAVVLCDFPGAGPMVTSANFDSLRKMNFGAGVLVNPLRSEHIRMEIGRYDPADAAEVSRRVRKEAGLADAVTRWLALYSSVLE